MRAWDFVDTPALLGKDLSIFEKVLSTLHPSKGTNSSLMKRPYKILYPQDFLPQDASNQVDAMESFINDICDTEGCCSQKISIWEDWRKTAPVEEKDLHQYLYNVSTK